MKYVLTIFLIIAANIFIFQQIDKTVEDSIAYEQQLLIQQAKAHFDDQVNTRSWNAAYGGIYVYPKTGQSPNPYLKSNTIHDEHNRTLIKINPAWMTRQLSELAKIEGYHFRITSLNPLNPSNKPDRFEEQALRNMLENNTTRQYLFDDKAKEFKYMGALITKPACMPCHKHQGYKVGDIRGGISVTIDSSDHVQSQEEIRQWQLWQKVIVAAISLIILFLMVRNFRHQETLEENVRERTQEINRTKLLLQAVLDAELSFLVVTDEHNVIYVNRTLLSFFGYKSQEAFEHDNINIIDLFEYEEGSSDEQASQMGWVEQLLNKQKDKSTKVIVKRDRQNRFFRPHVKEIVVDEKKLYLIIFDEITEHVEEKKVLETMASTDPLTGLANRSKFDQVLRQQVELATTTDGALSLIFLDIDHFKEVNDAYGHNMGDEILKSIARILSNNVRKGDLVARWGGEEFVIILQSANLDDAYNLAEKIRINTAMHPFVHQKELTISLGVTQYRVGEHMSQFVERADTALYQAKAQGRNQTVVGRQSS